MQMSTGMYKCGKTFINVAQYMQVWSDICKCGITCINKPHFCNTSNYIHVHLSITSLATKHAVSHLI